VEQTSGTTSPDKPRLVITAAPGSMLEDLLSQEHAAEAAARETADRLKGLRDQIKAELTQAHPGVERFDIAGTPHRPAKQLTWASTVRLNTRRLKDEQPLVYVEYAEFGGKWVLSPARGL
jgi:hypothetical protein